MATENAQHIQTDAFPRMVILEYSYVCNALCPACPYNYSGIRSAFSDTPFMRPDVFMRIVNECKKKDTLIRITGCGEPTLHPRLVADVAYAKQQGCKVALITNGTVKKKALLAMLEARIDAVEFSVDAGTREDYEKVRPGLDWYSMVDKVQIAVNSANGTRIIVSAVEQQGVNIDAVNRFWTGRNVDHVQIRRYLRWDAGPDKSANKAPLLEKNAPCPSVFQRTSISPRGDVSYCNEDSWFKHTVGNVLTSSIAQIWKSPEMEKIRDAIRRKQYGATPMCMECRDRQYKSWGYDYFLMTGGNSGR